MSAPLARAFDVTLTLKREGDIDDTVAFYDGGSLDWGTAVDVEELISKQGPHVTGTNGAVTLALSTRHQGGAVFDLIAWQMSKNDHDPATVMQRLDVGFRVQMPSGAVRRAQMLDCTAHGMNTSFGARTAKVATPVSLTAPKVSFL